MKNTERLYIDLLKNTLSFSLWPEPPMPLGFFDRNQNRLTAKFARALNRSLSKINMVLAKTQTFSSDERDRGEVWPGYADTMVGRKRLDNLEYCVREILADNVEGDFIETGVWRGGSCIFMRGLLAAFGVTDRKVFVADSFEGLPKPDVAKYPVDEGDILHQFGFLAVSEDQVRANFARYGLLDEQVVTIKGFFADTLADAPIEKLAILRLDGDMYSSTMDALNALYKKLSVGGFCIVDDYALPTCEKAVQDFRSANNITEPLVTIDNIAKYWRKQ